MKNKITLSEIAKRAGVNASTVSRVLHAKKGSTISAEVKEKVLKICDELNYRPNIAARSVVTGKKYCIGCILGNIQNDLASPIFANIIKGICCELQEKNYSLSILWAEKPGSSRDSQVKNFLMSDVADGYILGPTLIGSEIEKIIRKLEKPIVYVAENAASIPEDLPGAKLNCVKACEDLLKQIPESWHGKILYTGAKMSVVKVAELKIAMKNLGIDESAVKFNLFSPLEINFAFDRWAASQYAMKNLDMLKKQKLIWCASDLTALGIADVLSANGIKVGEDIAMIGYDNIANLVEFKSKPILTTIDPQPFELGKLTARTALNIIEGETNTIISEIDAKVIYRKTFEPLSKKYES